MEAHVFLEISLIIAVATIIATVMRALRQPLMIGHIITGLLLGPYVLNIVHSNDTVDVFSNLGIALLLFIIGLGLNPRVIKEVGKVSILTGVGQVMFTSIFGFGIATALGFETTSAIFIALALSFSSTIIILKLLSDKKELGRLYGKISTGFLLVQDIIATFILIWVATMSAGTATVGELVTTGLVGIGLIAALLLISWYVLPKLTQFVAASSEYLFLFSIAWGFGLAALFTVAGLSLEIGALFAGVALAALPYAQEISSRLRPLRDFFIILFFIALGARMGVDNLGTIWPMALAFSSFVLVGNPIIVMTIMGLLGYTKKTSFKAGLAVAQISEFSLILIILASRLGQIPPTVTSVVTLVAMITIAISTYMIMYSEQLYRILEPHLRLFERRYAQPEQGDTQPADIVLFGYKKGGKELLHTFENSDLTCLVVDYDPEVIDTLQHQDVSYAYGDATDSEFLDDIGVENAKIVVSVVTDFHANQFLINHLQEVNPRAIVIARADTNEEAAELYKHGATYVMMPHYIGSERITALLRRYGASHDVFNKVRERHLSYLRINPL